MILKKQSKGINVETLQKFLEITADGIFGDETEKLVVQWQKLNELPADGMVGPNTIKKMGITLVEEFDTKYKDITIEGSSFLDQPITDVKKITLSKEIVEEYIPALEDAMGDQPKGFKLLCTIMAHHEGYKQGTRSYRTNNPGNIGNTDSGRNKENSTLTDGILLQKKYILSIINGEHKAYPMGEKKVLEPYYSPEIAKNSKNYGMSPYLPGYEFIFSGQLDQFVKIYATGARAGNTYLSTIISFFKKNNIQIYPESKIQDIIQIT
jgi:hypothetical protein